jgi:dipeptidase E
MSYDEVGRRRISSWIRAGYAGISVFETTKRGAIPMPIGAVVVLGILGSVPFQINPHYLHGNPPGFKGETREERIAEFGALQPKVWVAGLREGTGLRVEGVHARLLGNATCRIFRGSQPPRELGADDSFDFLLDA